MVLPRPIKKTKHLPSVRCDLSLYIAVVEFLSLPQNKRAQMSFGMLVRRALALYITGNADHDFESQSTVIVGASVFADSAFDEQSRVAHGSTDEVLR